ncbi:MAG: hypothetical protein HYR88_17250, partial [Verrucomicrobia bacterium]|nr:hypothetical protein [Verrucomicrobiota bacterium]
QQLFGGAGDDLLYAFAPTQNMLAEYSLKGDQLFGNAGNDILYGNIRSEKLDGGDGNDVLMGDALSGPDYASNLDAAFDLQDDKGRFIGPADLLIGGSGEDQLYGGGGDDELRGNADSDFLDGQDGQDKVYGGAWNDIILLDTSPTANRRYLNPGDTIDGHGNTATGDAEDDLATDILLIQGSPSDDTIFISQTIEGRNASAQILVQINPSDPKSHQELKVIWRANDANGTPLIEQIQVAGLAGNDRIEFLQTNKNAGIYALDVSDLAARSADYVAVFNGGAGDDTLVGGAGRDELIGGPGNDALCGNGGDDRLWGDNADNTGSGNDSLFGGEGNDDLLGGGGNDRLYAWSKLPATNPRTNEFGVWDAQDKLEDTGLNRVLGGEGDDDLYGGTGADFLYAGGQAGDHLYDRAGVLFQNRQELTAGTTSQQSAWKDYLKTLDKVWYISGSGSDDVIRVDFVTEPGLLQGHHLVTRLTKGLNGFTFAADVRLDFDAVDSSGKRVWRADELSLQLNSLLEENHGSRGSALAAPIKAQLMSNLLPPEGDFSVIVIDALAGADQITVGPTVQKSVWIDAGAGDDKVEILSGPAILADQTESRPVNGINVRNDASEFAFPLGSVTGFLTPLARSTRYQGLTLDNPQDQDCYAFQLGVTPGSGDVLNVSADFQAVQQDNWSKLVLNAAVYQVSDTAKPFLTPRPVMGASPIEAAGNVQFDLASLSQGVTYLLRISNDQQTPLSYQLAFVLAQSKDSLDAAPATATDPARNETATDPSDLTWLSTGGAASGLTLDSATDVDWLKLRRDPLLGVADLPPDGRLTGEAVFTLTLGTETRAVSLKPDATNNSAQDLVDDLNTSLKATGFEQRVAASLVGNRLRLSPVGLAIGTPLSVAFGGDGASAMQDLGLRALQPLTLTFSGNGALPSVEVYQTGPNGALRVGNVITQSGQSLSVNLAALPEGEFLLRLGWQTLAEARPIVYSLSTPDIGTAVIRDLSNSQVFNLGNRQLISPSSRKDIIMGGDGDDILSGGPGEDWVFGGKGNDVLTGGLDHQSGDLLFGDEGNDRFQLVPDDLPMVLGSTRTYVPATADQFWGGSGNDEVIFIGGDLDRNGLPVPDHVALRFNSILGRYELGARVWDPEHQQFQTTTNTASRQYQIQYLFFKFYESELLTLDGRSGDDEIHAEPGYRQLATPPGVALRGDESEWGIALGAKEKGAPLINLQVLGGPGNDRLYGGVGDDRLFGGDGADIVFGGLGSDYVDGGAGNDIVSGDQAVVPDRYEIRGGDSGLRNDTYSFAANLTEDFTPLTRDPAADVIIRDLTFSEDDPMDWYQFAPPKGQNRFGQSQSVLVTQDALRISFEDPREQALWDAYSARQQSNPTGLGLPLALYAGFQQTTANTSGVSIGSDQIQGVPDAYYLQVLNVHSVALVAQLPLGSDMTFPSGGLAFKLQAAKGNSSQSQDLLINPNLSTTTHYTPQSLSALLESQLRADLKAGAVLSAADLAKIHAGLVNVGPIGSAQSFLVIWVDDPMITLRFQPGADSAGNWTALGFNAGLTNAAAPSAGGYELKLIGSLTQTVQLDHPDSGFIQAPLSQAPSLGQLFAIGNLNGDHTSPTAAAPNGYALQDFIAMLNDTPGYTDYQLYLGNADNGPGKGTVVLQPASTLRLKKAPGVIGFDFASVDLNHDGLDDLVVAIQGKPEVNQPRLAVLLGRASGWGPTLDVLDQADILSSTLGSAAALGGALTLNQGGDLNGDGVADLLVGDPENSTVFAVLGDSSWQQRRRLLDAGFETGAENFNVLDSKSPAQLWHLTNKPATPAGVGPAQFYFGIEPQNNYANGGTVVGALDSAPVSLANVRDGSRLRVSFTYLLSTENQFSPSDSTTHDLATVSLVWANSATPVLLASNRSSGGLAESGLQRFASSAIARQAGAAVTLRFKFDSGDAINNDLEGWRIDDVVVETLAVELNSSRAGVRTIKTSAAGFGRSLAGDLRIDNDSIADFAVTSDDGVTHLFRGNSSIAGSSPIQAFDIARPSGFQTVKVVNAGPVVASTGWFLSNLILQSSGASALVFGAGLATPQFSTSVSAVSLADLAHRDYAGLLVALGDVNKDGYSDLGSSKRLATVLLPSTDGMASHEVGVVFFGPGSDPTTLQRFLIQDSTHSAPLPDLILEPSRLLSNRGTQLPLAGILKSLGDLNGDGRSDLAILDLRGEDLFSAGIYWGQDRFANSSVASNVNGTAIAFHYDLATPIQGNPVVTGGGINLGGSDSVLTLDQTPALLSPRRATTPTVEVIGLGDINGDTFDDFLFYKTSFDPQTPNLATRASYLFLGPLHLDLSHSLESWADAVLKQNADADTGLSLYGTPANTMGDLTGDGIVDLTFFHGNQIEWAQGGHSVLNTVEGSPLSSASARRTFTAPGAIQQMISLDWDGPSRVNPNDANDTRVVTRSDWVLALTNQVVVFSAQNILGAGSSSLPAPVLTLNGAGYSVASLGDLTGDGRDELLVSTAGKAWVIRGGVTGTYSSPDAITPADRFVIDAFVSAAPLGDMEHDGFAEFAVVDQQAGGQDEVRIFGGMDPLKRGNLGDLRATISLPALQSGFTRELHLAGGDFFDTQGGDLAILEIAVPPGGSPPRSDTHLFSYDQFINKTPGSSAPVTLSILDHLKVIRGNSDSGFPKAIAGGANFDLDADGLNDLLLSVPVGSSTEVQDLALYRVYGRHKAKPEFSILTKDESDLSNRVWGGVNVLADAGSGGPIELTRVLGGGATETWYHFQTIGDGLPGDFLQFSQASLSKAVFTPEVLGALDAAQGNFHVSNSVGSSVIGASQRDAVFEFDLSPLLELSDLGLLDFASLKIHYESSIAEAPKPDSFQLNEGHSAYAGGFFYFTAVSNQAPQGPLVLWRMKDTLDSVQAVRDAGGNRIELPAALSGVMTVDPSSQTLYFLRSGTELMQLAKDAATPTSIKPGLTSAAGLFLNQGRIYFTNLESGKRVLWQSTGNVGTTSPLLGPQLETISDPGPITLFNSQPYFAATTQPAGRELWSITSLGRPELVKDFYVGKAGDGSALSGNPQFLAPYGDKLVLIANDATAPAGRLFQMSVINNVRVVDPFPIASNQYSNLGQPVSTGSDLFIPLTFTPSAGQKPLQTLLRVSDRNLIAIPWFARAQAEFVATDLYSINGNLVFAAAVPTTAATLSGIPGDGKKRLYVIPKGRSDPVLLGTMTQTSDFAPALDSSGNAQALYFTAVGVDGRREIWRTDGSIGGTVLARPVNPSLLTPNPSQVTVAGGRLYFLDNAPGSVAPGNVLWVGAARGVGAAPYDSLIDATLVLSVSPLEADLSITDADANPADASIDLDRTHVTEARGELPFEGLGAALAELIRAGRTRVQLRVRATTVGLVPLTLQLGSPSGDSRDGVKLSVPTPAVRMEIYDDGGHLILSGGSTVDIRSLDAGVYHLRVSSPDGALDSGQIIGHVPLPGRTRSQFFNTDRDEILADSRDQNLTHDLRFGRDMDPVIDANNMPDPELRLLIAARLGVAAWQGATPQDIRFMSLVHASDLAELTDLDLGTHLSADQQPHVYGAAANDPRAVALLKTRGVGGIRNLTGLEYAVNLRALYLERSKPTSANDPGLTSLASLIPGIRSDGREVLGQLGLGLLEVLTLDGNTGITSEDLSDIVRFRSLRSLSLDNTSVARWDADGNRGNGGPGALEAADSIQMLTRLEFLSIDRDGPTRGGISDLLGLQSLTALNTFSARNQLIQDISPLTGLSHLHYVDLRNNGVGDFLPALGNAWVDDDFNPAGSPFATTGTGWSGNGQVTDLTRGQTVSGSYHFHPKSGASDTATWEFSNLTPGAYRLFASFFAGETHAANVRYTLIPLDNDGKEITVTGKNGAPDTRLAFEIVLDQRFALHDHDFAGVNWGSLGEITLPGSKLRVEVNSSADGVVIADALRLETARTDTLVHADLRENPANNFGYQPAGRGFFDSFLRVSAPKALFNGVRWTQLADAAPGWNPGNAIAGTQRIDVGTSLLLPLLPAVSKADHFSVESDNPNIIATILNVPSDLPATPTRPAGWYLSLVPAAGFTGSSHVVVHAYNGPAGGFGSVPGREEIVLLDLQVGAGVLQGNAFADLNADFSRAAGEGGREGWTIFLDTNRNGVLDASEVSTAADLNGDFIFKDLDPSGEYVVWQVLPNGLKFTAGSPMLVENFDSGASESALFLKSSDRDNLWQVTTARRGDELPGHTPPSSLYFGSKPSGGAQPSPLKGISYELDRRVQGSVSLLAQIDVPTDSSSILVLDQLISIERPGADGKPLENVQVNVLLSDPRSAGGGGTPVTLAQHRVEVGKDVVQGALPARTNGWSALELKLSQFAGKRIWLQFSFDSVSAAKPANPANWGEGWFIDDLRALPSYVLTGGIRTGVLLGSHAALDVSTPKQTIDEGSPVTLTANVSGFVGASGSLQYLWSVAPNSPQPGVALLSPANASTFTFKPLGDGTFTVSLTVRDSSLVPKTFQRSVTINAVDVAPTVDARFPDSLSAVKDIETRIAGKNLFQDPGIEDFHYRWVLTDADQHIVRLTPDAPEFVLKNEEVGVYQLAVSASYAGVKPVTRTISVQISYANPSQFIAHPSPVSVAWNQALSYQLADFFGAYPVNSIANVQWTLKFAGAVVAVAQGNTWTFQEDSASSSTRRRSGQYDLEVRLTGWDQKVATSTTQITVRVELVTEHLFYNQSAFDGRDALAGASDDNAIATDKTALRLGQTATFANYSSYSRGLNGVMIDLRGASEHLSLADLDLRVGNSGDPSTWGLAPAPTSFTVRRVSDPGGSIDRVTLTWADGAIVNQWLKATLKATRNTGLATPEVFYFGHALGDTGDNPASAVVNNADLQRVLANRRSPLKPAQVTDVADINRDGFINALDYAWVRDNPSSAANTLRLFTAVRPQENGGSSASPSPSIASASASSTSSAPTLSLPPLALAWIRPESLLEDGRSSEEDWKASAHSARRAHIIKWRMIHGHAHREGQPTFMNRVL